MISLPPLILQTADRKVAESDNDGAAELYMLYLNSTSPAPTPDRKRAQKFLLDTYNFKAYGDPRNRDGQDKPLKTQKPEKIGKYEVLDVLGRGGMGVVYRARDARLGRIVAIKMLTEGFSGNADMLQRFYREASQTGALRHNNIVVVYDAGDQDGEPYIVMEYVEGEPLDVAIKRERMQLEHALTIVEQLCHALAYAHRNGVIHRDIKPANVILRARWIHQVA